MITRTSQSGRFRYKHVNRLTGVLRRGTSRLTLSGAMPDSWHQPANPTFGASVELSIAGLEPFTG
jgi:hypothetical protein